MKIRVLTLGSAIALALLAAAPAARPQSAPRPSNPGKIILYRLTTGDVVNIQIYGENLSVRDRIDARGKVQCALIGEVYLYGDTVQEAEAAIAKAYIDQEILRHPIVTLTVEEYAERDVSVQGQVKEPRRYPLPPETAVTLADIIEQAGGFTDVAKGTGVRVTRARPDGTVQVWEIDVEDFLKGRLKDKAKIEQAQLLLEPGDVIYVPERVI